MSTDIAESLPARKFAPAAMAKKGAKSAPPAAKGGGKPAAKGGGEKVRLEKVQKRKFVRQFMI